MRLPANLLESSFELIDIKTQKSIPYQVVILRDPLAAQPSAAHRWALGRISSTSLEESNYDRAHLMELVFIAEDVPSLGYCTYRLVLVEHKPVFASSLQVGENWIENRFYRVELNPATGAVTRLLDKTFNRDWVDLNAAHGLNGLVVRSAQTGETFHSRCVSIEIGEHGPLMASLVVKAVAPGVPQMTQVITLYENIHQVDFANRLLKDATPLQELYFAFPFFANRPHFNYEASNSVVEPIRDQLPGTNSDAYTAQHWVQMIDTQDKPVGIVWTSLDAPVIEVGDLWPGYVSQAHHGVTTPGYGHAFLHHPDQITHGHIYSYIMNNNFRTNFDPSQVADTIFRYSITSFDNSARILPAWKFGWEISNPFESACIRGPQNGTLPTSVSFCQVDSTNVQVSAVKVAEDGDGIILRLMEMEGRDTLAKVTLPGIKINQAISTNLVEENESVLPYNSGAVYKNLHSNEMATIRLKIDRTWPLEDLDYRI